MIPTTKIRVVLTLTEPMLGTVPKSKNLYGDVVQDPARREGVDDAALAEEIATVPESDERGWTGFHEDERGPFIYDYMIRGFFKAACYALRRVNGTLSAKISAYKKLIDTAVFIQERRIYLNLPAGAEMSTNERPLRAQTAQGERMALARSDQAPAGTTLAFTLEIINADSVSEAVLHEWFDYGRFQGLGQWRSGGYGRFTYTLEPA